MNTLYFACADCRAYVDAGYRHAYSRLEDTGIVNRSSAVDASAVLTAEDYWKVDADWLVQLLPEVRRFLEHHAEHDVRFGDIEDIPTPSVTNGLFDWVMEAGFVLEELPRYYVERLGFRTWDEVMNTSRVRRCGPNGGRSRKSEGRHIVHLWTSLGRSTITAPNPVENQLATESNSRRSPFSQELQEGRDP